MATIQFSATRTIPNGLSLTIDGGGKITFSGNSTRRMFNVNSGGNLTLRNIVITAGKDFGGGAVLNNGSLTVDSTKFLSNHASGQFGGAIKNIGSLTILNSELSNNAADTGYGGAVDSSETTSLVTVSGSTFSGNSAAYAGGAIANNGRVNISDSTFNGNHAGNSYGGGAIENTGPLTVYTSTFTNNAAGKGGAIYNEGGVALIQNDTISGNTASLSPHLGGGIHNQSGEGAGNFTIVATTFFANTASGGSGGNLSNENGSLLRIKLSILSGGNPSNCSGSVQSAGWNLSTDAGCLLNATGDLPNTMVVLAPLADNGGLTQTHALQPGSVVVDAVASGQCTNFSGVAISTDQRGAPRPADGDGSGTALCDFGAFELSSSAPNPTPTWTSSPTQTRTSSPTITPAHTLTPTLAQTNTFVPSATLTRTSTPTVTPTATRTFTPSATATPTPLPPTSTPTTTRTSTPSATATPTPLPPSATPTSTAARTNTPAATATRTATVTVLPTSTPTSASGFPALPILDTFNRANGTLGSNWKQASSVFSITSNQLTINGNGDLYWAAQPFGANQEIYGTFVAVDSTASEQDLLLKSQNASAWTSGVLEAMYDAPNHRAQVWTYAPSQGWLQRGADIPVTLVNGDQFGARAYSSGVVEVYRNGNRIGSVDVSAWPFNSSGGTIGLWMIGANNAVMDQFGGGTLP